MPILAARVTLTMVNLPSFTSVMTEKKWRVHPSYMGTFDCFSSAPHHLTDSVISGHLAVKAAVVKWLYSHSDKSSLAATCVLGRLRCAYSTEVRKPLA